MKYLAFLVLALISFGFPKAHAQVSCAQQNQTALLNQFADTAPAGSIAPSSVRNVICSSLNILNNLSDVPNKSMALSNLGGMPNLGFTPLNPVNNLSDVANSATALANLSGIAQVANTTSLRATSTLSYPNGVIRLTDGVAGAPPLYFSVGSEVCSTDDGASCVNSANGASWIGQFSGLADVRQWGAKCDGTTATSVTFQAALTAIGANGGGVVEQQPTGAACVLPSGLIIPAGVHLKGSGGLNWTSPIDNVEGHWTNKASWFHCEDTVNPCITLSGNSSSIEGFNYWYTQPTPTGGNCGSPCTYVSYSPTVYPYTIYVAPTATVGVWIINNSIVNASHCVDWEGPTSGVTGIYSGMDRDSFGCFDVGTRFHLIDNTLTLSRLRYEMWWEQGNGQWWYAQQANGTHVDWDVEYLANPQVTDVEFTFGGIAMKFTDASVTSGFGTVTFAVSGMQAKGVSFNENCQAMVVANSTTHVSAILDNTILFTDSTTSPISGQCAQAQPYAIDLASDNVNVRFNGIDGGFVQSIAFIGGGGSIGVHGQLHLSNVTVQKYSAYATGAPAVATDTTGSIIDWNGGTPFIFPGTSAGPLCSAGGTAGANGCQSNANSFIGQLELGGAVNTTREYLFTQQTPGQAIGFTLGTAQWGLRADGPTGEFLLDRFNPVTGAFIDPPWFIVPTGTSANQTQFQITGETVTHGGIYMVPILIANLPACGPGNAGMVETVSNAPGSQTYNSVVSATGSTAALVVCNNTNWVYQ